MASEFRGYALLVGVGECEYARLSLPVTVKDGTALRDILVDPALCGYRSENIQLLANESATQRGILEGLGWLKGEVEQDRRATVVVFYSGHGWRNEAGDYYLLPHDFDPMDKQGSALSAAEFTQALREIEAERLLVIVDCCHAAGMAAAKSPKLEQFQKGLVAPGKGLFGPLAEKSGRAVFLSCSGEQSSYIRDDKTLSVFTFHLLEALRGAGSLPGDLTVTVSQLMKHLGRSVGETARGMGVAQDPLFSFETEDFAVALLRGGKGLPEGGWDAVKGEAMSGAQVQVQASGDRSIATTGDVNGPIVTGDGNVVGSGNIVQKLNQRGQNNMNLGSAQNFSIGDTIYNDKE
ncbi:MAG: caspase family protein [Synechococcales cyanobacterium CRU_2_2]|nr:caspase family protein [Synechococcales cyanobacterium CRU_2_2]